MSCEAEVIIPSGYIYNTRIRATNYFGDAPIGLPAPIVAAGTFPSFFLFFDWLFTLQIQYSLHLIPPALFPLIQLTLTSMELLISVYTGLLHQMMVGIYSSYMI
jgi:hypothetical protein